MTNVKKSSWAEVYDGGSLEAEREGLHQLAQAMLDKRRDGGTFEPSIPSRTGR
jgi:hypothetical protein